MKRYGLLSSAPSFFTSPHLCTFTPYGVQGAYTSTMHHVQSALIYNLWCFTRASLQLLSSAPSFLDLRSITSGVSQGCLAMHPGLYISSVQKHKVQRQIGQHRKRQCTLGCTSHQSKSTRCRDRLDSIERSNAPWVQSTRCRDRLDSIEKSCKEGNAPCAFGLMRLCTCSITSLRLRRTM